MIQSLILPGWGQWSQDRKITSSALLGSMVLSGAALYSKDSEYKSFKKNYNSAKLNGFLLSSSPALAFWSTVRRPKPVWVSRLPVVWPPVFPY
jgi:hypothetical protein